MIGSSRRTTLHSVLEEEEEAACDSSARGLDRQDSGFESAVQSRSPSLIPGL